ncbi:MAG: adenylate/guanylate cyclase domain-containing protein [Rhizobiaceae bacterium]|nr:adenylate/guanylate cyclase domain-containing protein [Rhizobiaceae bacterium]
MTEERVQRRLAAIVMADVVGYSRLMETDELATLATLKDVRATILQPIALAHGGRIVKVMGDGFLMEFTSAVNAVAAGIELQSRMAEANSSLPEARRIVLRVGINLGDVVIDGGDLYGDGINVAARLQSLAQPGEIYVSASVHDQVNRKIASTFDDLGPKSLKNIARPVQIYRVRTVPLDRAPEPSVVSPPGKPSIAVLPFETGGNDQEWFSDGIAEDITTALAKSRRLRVVSKNYSFATRGRDLRGSEIARDLGVQYLLEGSVRLLDERVRVSTRLLEGASGELLWAERFDRNFANVFAIQDEITEAVVRHLELELLPDERQAIRQARTENIEAYHHELRGRQLMQALTKSNLLLARRMFGKAAELDPGYARAYAGMVICDCYLRDWHGQHVSADDILPIAEKALDLDPGLPEARIAHGFAQFCMEKYDEADRSYKEALVLDPNSFEANFFYASTIVRFRNDRKHMVSLFKLAARLRPDDYVSPIMIAGFVDKDDPDRIEWARECVERAERASRLYPEMASPLHRGALAFAYLGDRTKAYAWLERALAIDPDEFIALVNAAGIHARFGEVEDALRYLERAGRDVPQNTIDMMRNDADFDSIREDPRFSQVLRPREY